jgi:hypothetical protein
VNQTTFFKKVRGEIRLQKKDGVTKLYKELVYYRFYEVITNAFPRFTQALKPKRLEKLIKAFVKSNPTTPLIWQMPREFMHFVCHNPWINQHPYFHDLLWFEWIEIEIFMGEVSPRSKGSFSWKKNYNLTPSTRLKTLEYPVYRDDYQSKGAFPILLFYNFADHEVHYQEVTPLMSLFLSSLDTLGTDKALNVVASSLQSDKKTVRKLLTPSLKQFYKQRIIKEN